jgi:hypothetical protein
VQLSIPDNGTQFVRELGVFPASTGITSYPLWTDVVSNEPPATQWETYGDGFWSLINCANPNALVASATVASLTTPNPRHPSAVAAQLAGHLSQEEGRGNEANWGRFVASYDYNWNRNPSMPSPAQVVFPPEQRNGAAVSALPQYAPGWHTNPKPMALLGFNEPDRSDQANMTTASAISLWPQLQAVNVPIVGPATSWLLTSWMSNSWSLANSAGYRIDESGFHWYS